MALPFKPKGASPPAETKGMDAMAPMEPDVDDTAPMGLAEAGSLALRAQKAGDGEAFAEAVLKIVAAGGAP
jgi:hypothetical protein